MQGKSAMVWKLRNWKDGDPAAQVAQCRDLGLTEVAIKIVNGRSSRWEWNLYHPDDQNEDLLPFTIAALREVGIKVCGWGYEYGGYWISRKLGQFVKSASIAKGEGQKAGDLCLLHEIDEFWVDVEGEYDRDGMEPSAEAFMAGFQEIALEVKQTLCSYRFPTTYQPKVPVEIFAPHMEGWSPQVYFVGDNRKAGGAIQLEISFGQYMKIRKLPYVAVAPTYADERTGWRATYDQLIAFFAMAKSLGCSGISVWDLPQANADQLAAIKDFAWTPVEPPVDGVAEAIRNEAKSLRSSADVLDGIAYSMEG